MSHNNATLLSCLVLCLSAHTAAAQSEQKATASNLVSKSVTAIGFPVGSGSIKVDLKGTEVMTQANGEAKVEAKQGKTNIEITVKSLEQPSKLGAELLTYVVWIG